MKVITRCTPRLCYLSGGNSTHKPGLEVPACIHVHTDDDWLTSVVSRPDEAKHPMNQHNKNSEKNLKPLISVLRFLFLSHPFSFFHSYVPPPLRSALILALGPRCSNQGRITHLSVLMAAGGAYCERLAWMRGFRLLPSCKVIVIKTWLTVVPLCL